MITSYYSTDAPFLAETVGACCFGSLTFQQVEGLFASGEAIYYLCVRGSDRTGVVVYIRQPEAQFIAFHREGDPKLLRRDSAELLKVIRWDMQRLACTRFVAQVERSNPRCEALQRFYKRVIGLQPKAVVMEGAI